MALPMTLSAVMALLLASAAIAAEEQKPAAPRKAASSLDEEVLKGLGLDPLTEDLLPEKPAPEKAKGDQAGDKDKEPSSKREAADQTKPAEPSELDQELLKGLMEGEDIGAPNDPFMRIGRKMRQAGDLIARKQSGDETQTLQQRILEDLEKLIEQARRQQQQQQASSSSQQSSRREMVKQSQPGQPQNRQSPSNNPAQQSTERLGKNEVRRPDPAQVNDLIKSIWGQLPGRAREEMLWNANDEFLPKYELEIEAYFKSLVEQQQKNP